LEYWNQRSIFASRRALEEHIWILQFVFAQDADELSSRAV
jgi:hypothetical protein